MKSEVIQLQLTPSEADLWDWAQSESGDYWIDDKGRDDGLHFDECPVWSVEAGTAKILNISDVLIDMLYRIEEMMGEIAVEQVKWYAVTPKEQMKAVRTFKTIKTLSAKIRKHIRTSKQQKYSQAELDSK